MVCKEAESYVMPYIRHQMPEEKLEEFLEHVETCENCREELEIYYTVDVGIRRLDADTGNYNIKGAMEADLIASRQWLQFLRLFDIIRYAMDTLVVMSLVVMVILQFRIWYQIGFF
ncbi:MAG: anti-sigma factor family protein [Hungatella sp.]